jgi:hypothetical protein
MAVVLPHDISTKTIVAADELQEQFEALQAKFNAGISAADLAASAGILLSQLEASYEHIDVVLGVRAGDLTAGWPAAAHLDNVPVPGLTGASPWVAEGLNWMCRDTGDGLGSFNVVWGYHNAAGAWTTVANLTAAPIAMVNATSGANSANAGTVLVAASLPVGAQPRSLALISAVGSATTLAGGVIYDMLRVVVRLRRQISAA